MTSFLRLFLCLLVSFSSCVVAQERANLPGKPPPPDVRLVIDVSGSMKRNDPNNLRQPAVDLLVKLLPENSRAGVWTFGKWINMLVPHKTVTDEWRADAQKKSGEISSVGLYTNIGEALEKAAYDAGGATDEFHTSIIMLTDGMVDIDKSPEINKLEWRRIVDEVLPKLKQSGITIHTIALSDNADKNLMNKLSLGTGGMAEVAHSADDLMRIFLKTFDAAVPSEQVPLTDNQFVIDSSVEEFTALIFRRNPQETTELVGPDQVVYTANNEQAEVKWHRSDKYDLITVTQPLEGEWNVKADMDPESRVTVVSNLNLRVAPLPVNVFKGQQEMLNLLLQEDGKTIVRPEFLSLMSISAAMEAGNDEFDLRAFWNTPVPSEPPPEDGHYSLMLPAFDKDGIYQLSVQVDGKTFIRQFTHQFTVRQPFGAEVKQVFTDGKLEYLLVASSYRQNIDIPRTQVAATVIAPNGRKKIRPLEATGVDTWEAKLSPDIEGDYRARIKAKGVDNDGNEFDITLDDISFNYSVGEGFTEEKDPFFEPTPEPTPTPTPTPEPTPEAEPEHVPAPIPKWMLYALLVLGNMILFGIGFFAFKKIMGNQEELLDQFSDERINTDLEAPEEEPEPEPEPEPEEEPPMEDLDPSAEEMDTMPIDDIDDDDLDPVIPSVAEESLEIDGLDDLDGMDDITAGVDDDEMVADMLKAQGLDLAEDELDEAISNLIDDLDAEGAGKKSKADAEAGGLDEGEDEDMDDDKPPDS